MEGTFNKGIFIRELSLKGGGGFLGTILKQSEIE
jgi:hypothetical protein